MRARDPRAPHRSSTTLELLFDLCFAVAVSQAAARLHHAALEGHLGAAVLPFGLVFFAIWWGWMNFTWFASAYDNDDVAYRLAVFVQIAGALVVAAGVPRAFEDRAFGLVTLGYTIMRVGLVPLWLRAARDDAGGRATARRYAIGLVACQVGWIALLAVPNDAWAFGWLALAPAELLVPIWAERPSATAWHPHHVVDRFASMALIVLGESVLSATVAIQSAVDAGGLTTRLALVIVGGLLTLFSMWWLYFDRPPRALTSSRGRPFAWGYGHYFVFASTAAVGAGLGSAADAAIGRGHGEGAFGNAAVGVPVAIYLLTVFGLHIAPTGRRRTVALLFAAAGLLCLAVTPLDGAVLLIGLILVALAIASTRLAYADS